MADSNATLIKMEGVKKVFLTDEVETHALEEIHLEIKKGTYISIAGPSGCGKSTLLSILGLLDSPSRRELLAQRPAGVEPDASASARGFAIARSASSFRRST